MAAQGKERRADKLLGVRVVRGAARRSDAGVGGCRAVGVRRGERASGPHDVRPEQHAAGLEKYEDVALAHVIEQEAQVLWATVTW